MKIEKVKNVFSWILQILLGLEFIIAGQAKFTTATWESMFEKWGYPDNFYLVIGALEVICGVLLFIPKLAGYSAVVLSIVMISAGVTHIMHDQSPVVEIIILALLIILFLLRFPKRMKFMEGEA